MRNSVYLLAFIFIFTFQSFAQTTSNSSNSLLTENSNDNSDNKPKSKDTKAKPKKDKTESDDSDDKNTTEAKTPLANKFNLPPEKMKPVTITKFAASPTIDGKLDEDMWKQAFVFKDFYQTQPGDNIPSSKPTEAFLGYDEKFLYIGFRCYDEPDKVRATIAKRDEVFGEDNVRIWLDTFNDQRRAYILGFNPLGIQQDGIFHGRSRRRFFGRYCDGIERRDAAGWMVGRS